MKVRVTDIGPDGLAVHGAIPVSGLNERISQGSEHDIVFLSDPILALTVHSTVSGAYTEGSIRARYRQPCARCAETREHELLLDANFVFQHRADHETVSYLGETDTHYDDVGVYYFSGEHIELEELVQETLILAVAPFWRPPLREDDTCALCGKRGDCIAAESSDSAITFGHLLRNAGVK